MTKIIKAGTRIHIGLDAGFAGMDEKTNYTLSEDLSEKELDELCWDMALSHAEGYGVYYATHYEEEDRDDEDDGDNYTNNIGGYWELYDEKKHHGHHEGGML